MDNDELFSTLEARRLNMKQRVGPSPSDVAGTVTQREGKSSIEAGATAGSQRPRSPSASARLIKNPPIKRKRQDQVSVEDQTPTMAPEMGVHQATSDSTTAATYTSMSSDLTCNSRSSPRLDASSPLPLQHSRIPPAPPSTPASLPGSSRNSSFREWDASPGSRSLFPAPLLDSSIVANAAQLVFDQQQQHVGATYGQTSLPDGAATPAPTMPHRNQSKTATASNLTSGAVDDFSDWAVGDRYELVRMLGRGSYGEVAQAIDKQANRHDAFVAIKRVTRPFDQPVDAVRLYREIHILRRMCGHESIIQLLGIIQPPSHDINDFQDLYMVFEYVDTDLYKLIMSPQYLTTEHIQAFLYQMLAGLKYIHSHSVIHRDLKPANILLNEDCSLKICDFGLSRIVDSASMATSSQAVGKVDEPPITFGPAPLAGLTRQLTKHVVTRWYRAPELILMQPYTSAVDLWSVACIMAELLSMQEGNVAGYQDRQPLFPGGTCYPLSGDGQINKDEKLDQLSVIFRVIGTPSMEDMEAVGKATEYIASLGAIKGKSLEVMYPAADPVGLDLLRHLLQFNPKKRYTAEQALEHEFFKGIRRPELERNAPGSLEGPAFLEAHQIDIEVVKQKTMEECIDFAPRVA